MASAFGFDFLETQSEKRGEKKVALMKVVNGREMPCTPQEESALHSFWQDQTNAQTIRDNYEQWQNARPSNVHLLGSILQHVRQDPSASAELLEAAQLLENWQAAEPSKPEEGDVN